MKPPQPENEYFGLAIGFVIVAGGYAAGGISGGACLETKKRKGKKKDE